MKRLTGPFGVWKRMEKVGYCNRMIIPRLKVLGIDWDMTPDRIIFCGERFAMGTIDDGRCEAFIDELCKDGQSRVIMWSG